MIVKIGAWLVDFFVTYWNFLLSGGIIGGSIIVLLILRKLASFIRQFTN